MTIEVGVFVDGSRIALSADPEVAHATARALLRSKQAAALDPINRVLEAGRRAALEEIVKRPPRGIPRLSVLDRTSS